MATDFTPVISTDENGEEFVDYDNGQLHQRNQFHRGFAPQGFEINEETGDHYVFEEPEDEQGDFMEDYLSTMTQANPELQDDIAYGNENLSPEIMSILYSAVDDGDLDSLHDVLEIILAEFDDARVATPEEREETLEESEEEEDVYETPDLSNLYEQEPNEELAYEHADLAEQTEGVESLLWSLSASFFNGDLTQDEAIEQALSSGYSRNQLIETFNRLNESTK